MSRTTRVILVADGARPDTLVRAMDDGALPTLDALRRSGSAHSITSVFPSVTGPAYVPFLMGLHPGEAGIPGIRWWDRAGTRAYAHGNARSYVGFEALRQDGDLTRAHPTLFELSGRALAALTPIGRGLAAGARVGAGMAWWPRLAWTHFRGDVAGWLRLERTLAERVAERVHTERPDLVFFAHQGVDKCSHQLGQEAPEVREALRLVDAMAARLLDDAARRGDAMELLVVSDHGHTPVHAHDDLADVVRAEGHGVLAHPWTFAGGDDVAVMVSGNAMAHLYLDLTRPSRAWWPALADRWTPLVRTLLSRDAVDLLLLPHAPSRCEVRSRDRGAAMVERTATGGHAYRPLDGDPLGLGGAVTVADADAAHDATLGTTYPDALVQIITLAGAARAGDLIISAAPGWDLRSRHEPIPHVSTHGSLHRDHLLVPLISSRPLPEAPRRTTAVFSLAHP